jgi:hypothetical protein
MKRAFVNHSLSNTVVKSSLAIGSILGALMLFPALGRSQDQEALNPGLYRLEMIMAATTRIRFFGVKIGFLG